MTNKLSQENNKSNLIKFFVAAYLFSWVIWGIAVYITNFTNINVSWLPIVIIIIGAFGPSVTAVWLTHKNGEKGAVKKLLKRGLQIKTIPVWIWISMFIVPAMSWAGSMFYFQYSGVEASFNYAGLLFFPFSALIMIVGGPLQEEFGWRGYALDRMQKKYSALVASIILGIIWAAWHLPLFFIVGSAQQGIDLPFYFVSLIGISIIMTWFYNNSKASILVALLAHAIINSMSELFIFAEGFGGASYNYYAITQLIIAVIIVLFWGSKTLAKSK